jgi:excisionase family DNA binding protein
VVGQSRAKEEGDRLRLSKAVTVGQAATDFGVTSATVRNWIRKGYLQAIRLPSGHHRIPESEVTRMLDKLFSIPVPVEETEERRVAADSVKNDEWGPAV